MLLEVVHGIIQHLLVYLSTSAVALDEVAQLYYHACVLLYQLRRSLHETWTALAPHLSVSGKLSTLNLVEPFHLFDVMAVIDRCRFCIVMGISQDDNGITGWCLCADSCKKQEGDSNDCNEPFHTCNVSYDSLMIMSVR